jgi:hypothetical protein
LEDEGVHDDETEEEDDVVHEIVDLCEGLGRGGFAEEI